MKIETYGAADLSESRLAGLFERLPDVSIAVVGDFFLDKYLIVDQALAEVSLETGLEAHQVVAKRCSPGAAGTVTNNLTALGVGAVYAVGFIGEDGEGFDLARGLEATGVRLDYLVRRGDLFTPTYTKPMLRDAGGSEREMSRLDVKNRQPLPREAEDAIIARLEECFATVDGVIVADQVQERDRGVITDRVRERLSQLAAAHPEKVTLVDSRARIGEYRNLTLKPNRAEAAHAIGGTGEPPIDRDEVAAIGLTLSRRSGRPAYVTLSEDGVLLCDGESDRVVHVPGVPVRGEIDPVGAGDSASAGIVAARCAGASPIEAALVANLVASLIVQQIGTTGTTSPARVVDRHRLARSL